VGIGAHCSLSNSPSTWNLKIRIDHCSHANQHALSPIRILPCPCLARLLRAGPSQLRRPSAMLLPLHRSLALPPPLQAALDELATPGFANLGLEPPPSQISASCCPCAFSLLSRGQPARVAVKDGRGWWSWRHMPSQWKATPRIE
jgi:hypothetical protein